MFRAIPLPSQYLPCHCFHLCSLFLVGVGDVQFPESYALIVPAGSPFSGGDVKVYVKDINQPSLPTPFYSDLESTSVFMALSTVFHLSLIHI